jgi:hypothetical protein
MAQRRITSLIRQGFFCLGKFIMTYYFFLVADVSARPMNSIQLASGEWNVSIQGGFWNRIDASRIFPSVSQRSFFSQRRRTRTSSEMTIPSVKRRPWGTRSLDCILSLSPDGTFILAPKKIIRKYSSSSSSRKVEEEISMNYCDMSTIEKQSKSSTGVMYIRGCWNVLANPYCLTDRRYDEVSLTSYPRQRITSGAATDNPEEERVPQTVQMTMNCRLWGRHGRQPQQSYRQEKNGEQTCCGKMTHGTIVWKEHGHGVPWWKQFYRPVLGSFSAVRSSKEPKHDGWLDKEFFGY